MKRFWSLAATGLLATGALGACGESTEPAAVVNGVEISQQDVVDELEAIKGNDGYVEAYEASAAQSQGEAPTISGSADDTFNTAFVTSTLTTRILYGLVHSEVEKREIAIDDECRSKAAEQAAQRVAAASPEGDGEAVLDDFGADYKAYLIDREADLLALQADLADQQCVDPEAAEAYYDEHRDEFETACVRHILVATEEEAEAAKAEIDAGTPFATVAAEVSTDTGSAAQGGDLGCNPRGMFVPEFEDAAFSLPIDEVSDPIQTQFGFHIILVTERGIGTFEEVQDQVAQALATQVDTAFSTWFQTAVTEAEVTVDPRYGTWDPAQATIAPNDVPADDPADPADPSQSTVPQDTSETIPAPTDG